MSNILNLSTLRTELKDRLKRPNLSNTRIDRWCNIAQDEIIRAMDPDHLIESTSFSCVADERTYYIECVFNKIKDVINEDTETVLTEESEKDIRKRDPDLTNTGNPYCYSLGKRSMVKDQPSSDSVISVSSSSASDSTQTLRIRGSLDGIRVTDSISLNGTSTVAGTTTMDTVNEVILDTAPTGTITITSNAAAITIAEIPTNELFVEYQEINLYYTPSSTDTIAVYYIRQPRPLDNPSDIPDLPHEWHDLVLIGAYVIGLRDIFEFELAAQMEMKFLDRIDKLSKQMGNSRNKKRRIRLQPKQTTSYGPTGAQLATDV